MLRTPDVFETDDPVRYTLWREQFLNWLTFCDTRYGDLIKDLENLECWSHSHFGTRCAGAEFKALLHSCKLSTWPQHFKLSEPLHMIDMDSRCGTNSRRSMHHVPGREHWPSARLSCSILASPIRNLCWKTFSTSTPHWTSMSWHQVKDYQIFFAPSAV